MEIKQHKHIIDLLFVIALFCLFALSSIFLISIGANIYGKTTGNMEGNFNTRTTIAYLTEKVRQSDLSGQLSLGELEGNPAIIISSEVSGINYKTYLYEYDHQLKELLVREDLILGPEAGQNIIPVTDFSLKSINNSLFGCFITLPDNQCYEIYIHVYSGGIADEN